MNTNSNITYPYFFLGFESEIRDIKIEMVGDLSIYRRFTFEEAIAIPGKTVIKAVYMICGTPDPMIENEPSSACSYKPIKMRQFVDNNGLVLTQANLNDRRNSKVYINGKDAIEKEDYEIILKENRIKILWDHIKDSDTFSFRLPMRSGPWN